ncbi:MAG: ribonuclease III [Clostridia bacterium]|nr:ribonuclease III [Clostridia bacterium]
MFNNFKLTETEVKALSSISLAFVGDAVYSLHVRQKLLENKDEKAGALNKKSASIVCATAQSKLADKWLNVLTEEELYVFKRARNAKKGTRAKNASVADYNKATGLEAVIGYLYLLGNVERLNYLLNYGEKDEN